MSQPTPPWWSRTPPGVSEVSAGEAAACRFRTLVSTECKVEADANGNPQRKCERIFRKFKDCPGRPMEVVERVEESTTEPNFKHEAPPWSEFQALRAPEEGSTHVISSEMGQLLEEVLAAFERDFTLEGNSRKSHERVSQFARDAEGTDSGKSGVNESVFGRFFRKKPKEPSQNPGPPNSDVYGEYADDFQEV